MPDPFFSRASFLILILLLIIELAGSQLSGCLREVSTFAFGLVAASVTNKPSQTSSFSPEAGNSETELTQRSLASVTQHPNATFPGSS